MEKPNLPMAGGLGAAAMLAFFLGPLNRQSNYLSPGGSQSGAPPAATSAAGSTPSSLAFSLSRNEQGPWYALCNVFSALDPEDLEKNPRHSSEPEAGIVIHPPLRNDAERTTEEIKEETITEGRIQRKFAPHYHFKGNLASCLPSGKALSERLDLNYIIATIPDPLGSHLSLQFDRNVVAIERAAEANGYGFERYWFPWSGLLQAQPNERESGIDQLKQNLRQQPGILIFRKFNKFDGSRITPEETSIYSPRLLVFLVGETPTAGINKVAFGKAARYIVELNCRINGSGPCPWTKADRKDSKSDPCTLTLPIKILGPNFSASFSPLYRTLQDTRDLTKGRICISADVRSPTTTVEAIRDTFDRELYPQHLGTFTPISPPDCTTETAMLRYLQSIGYQESDVAYLSEDETSYSPGNKSLNTDDTSRVKGVPALTRSCSNANVHIPTLTYPRDLSALRNTWQEASIEITPADISGEPVKTQIVPFSLHEQTSNELDSPVAFATEQAAPDTDQALSNITTSIRHNRYRVIIVTASNPLDEAFLLQYLRHNAPDVRLATYDQDVLMLRALNFDPLRGTISVTSFPLVNTRRFQGALGRVDAGAFPNSSALATFVVADAFINGSKPDDPLNSSRKHVPLFTYLRSYPGTYLLGSDAFWTVQEAEQSSPFYSRDPIVPWVWYIFMLSVACLALLHLWTYRKLYRPHRPKNGVKSIRSFYQSLRMGGSRRKEDLAQDYFLFVGNNQLIIALALIAIPSLIVSYHNVTVAHRAPLSVRYRLLSTVMDMPPLTIELAVCVVLLITTLLVLVRAANTSWKITRADLPKPMSNSTDRLVETVIVTRSDFMVAAMYPIITVTIIAHSFLADAGNVTKTAYRLIYILDGLSPIPVIVAIITVWYFFSFVGIRAVKTMKAMRVDPLFLSSKLPDDSAPWVKALGSEQATLLRKVETWIRLDGGGLVILLSSFGLLFALQGWTGLRGIDNVWFRGWLVFGGIGLLTASIIVQFFRIRSIWSSLRTLLRVLSASPLSSGFERLPEELRSVKAWRSVESVHSLPLQVHTFHSLRRIRDDSPSQVKASITPFLNAAECHLQSLSYNLPLSQDTHLHDHTLLNACFDACISPSIGDDMLWFQRRCNDGDQAVIDYVALRYVALIKYINSHLRWLLAFALYGYVFLIFGVGTYPFQGQHSIASMLTIVFGIIFVLSAVIFVQMDSDRLLSVLEHTTPGKTNYFEAAWRLLSVGAIPLIAILASQFPIIERFVFSWIKPTLESLH